MIRQLITPFVAASLLLSIIFPVPPAEAQNLLGLPEPGTMMSISPAYNPAMIKGVMIHKDNPFLFDFIVDVGQDHLSGERLKKEGEKLIKYFLAGLTVPQDELWVNLSPYEKDRIIPEVLSQTAMGRDLLAQDYILKQITASLIYPDKDLGRVFWDRVYSQARQMYGTTEVPVNTFNKVWITADRAEVYVHNNTAFVVDCHLKVMLDQDYLAMRKNSKIGDNPRAVSDGRAHGPAPIETNSLGSQITRAIILPELEKEVNTGKNFYQVRQIFNSIILASWYKNTLKQALLNQVYANKGKVKGIDLKDKTLKDKIYRRYLQAYKKGVFNYIKEDIDPLGGDAIPRKYFSGGMDPGMATRPEVTFKKERFDRAMSRLDLRDFKTVMSEASLSNALVQQHLGTAVQVFDQYTLPDGRTYPYVRISEVYNSGFSQDYIDDIRAQIKKNPNVHAFLLRKSVVERALRGDQDIELTDEMGEIPANFLFKNLKKTVKLSKKATEILPSFRSDSTERMMNAPAVAVRVGAYFRTEIIDDKFNEPLYLLCFNHERFIQNKELVITPIGGGAEFDGEEGRELYTKSGLHLEPIQVSPLDKKNERKAMRQLISLSPEYRGTDFPFVIFSRVYNGGRASALKEGFQEMGPDELNLFNKGQLLRWIRQMQGAPSVLQPGKWPRRPSTNPDYAQTTNKPKPVFSAHPDLLNGGIDLNTQQMKWKIRQDGRGVEMNMNPAMLERVKREGLDSLTPVISRISPVSSIWTMIGLQSPASEYQRLSQL